MKVNFYNTNTRYKQVNFQAAPKLVGEFDKQVIKFVQEGKTLIEIAELCQKNTAWAFLTTRRLGIGLKSIKKPAVAMPRKLNEVKLKKQPKSKSASIIEALQNGLSPQDVAQKFDIPIFTAYGYLSCVKNYKTLNNHSEELTNRILKLYKSGMSIPFISVKEKISENKIHKVLNTIKKQTNLGKITDLKKV